MRRAAAAEVHPDRFAVLVVGPAAARAQLAAFGEVHDLDITIPEPPPEPGEGEDGAEPPADGAPGNGGGR